MKKIILLLVCIASISTLLIGCNKKSDSKDSLVVLNYGKYIDPQVLELFEDETGINVSYEEYTNPEAMYTKYKAGSINYDLICTSDYIIEKLIKENEVLEMNLDNIPLSKNLDPTYFELSKSFDPENKYTMPYFFGTVGILYNSTIVEEEVNDWSILWNEKYADNIIMQDSVRDSFMVALKSLNYSSNATDESQLQEALQLLIKQKPLVLSYLVDEAADEMIAGNAAMALVYSGEAAYAQSYNEDLKYAVPENGSNMWIDSWFIPKTSKNEKNAELFLDFLCREDIATLNFEYVYYATPNTKVFEALDSQVQTDTTIFPDKELLKGCEIYSCLEDENITHYNDLWKELKGN